MEFCILNQNESALFVCKGIFTNGCGKVYGYINGQEEPFVLGNYKTEERAKEIIKEILRHMVLAINKIDFYDMPKI